MNGAILLLVGIACFTLAYFFYSRFIAKAIGVDPSRPTPAHTMGDGIDYVPAHPMVLYGHHFAAIAGAGPIIGTRPCGAVRLGGRGALDCVGLHLHRFHARHGDAVPLGTPPGQVDRIGH